jgi:20S proteasome subunit beta 6
MSNLLAAIMYDRRMFPYFTSTILGGLDRVGRGVLFRYDAVGSFERVRAVCAGKGEQLMQPALDRLTNMEEDAAPWRVTDIDDVFESTGEKVVDLSVDEACAAVLEAYRSAAEREITVGDGVEMMVVERDTTNDGGGGGGGSGDNGADGGIEGRSSTSRQPWPTRTRWLSYPLAKH